MSETYEKKQREKKRDLKKKMKLEKRLLKKDGSQNSTEIAWDSAPVNRTLSAIEISEKEMIKSNNLNS